MFGLLTCETPHTGMRLDPGGGRRSRDAGARFSTRCQIKNQPVFWGFFFGLFFTSSPTFKAVSERVAETKLQTSTSAVGTLRGRRCATGSAEQVLPLQRGVYLLPSAYEMPPEVQGLKGEVKEPSLAVSSHSTQTKYTFYRAPLLTLRRVPPLLFA